MFRQLLAELINGKHGQAGRVDRLECFRTGVGAAVPVEAWPVGDTPPSGGRVADLQAVFVDKDYRDADVPGVKVWRSGQRRGVTRRLQQDIRRRSAIEPMIGHMKNEGLLRRNWLRGSLGDALHAVLCGAGHNLRMTLRKLRLLRARILALLETLPALPATAKNSPAPTRFAE